MTGYGRLCAVLLLAHVATYAMEPRILGPAAHEFEVYKAPSRGSIENLSPAEGRFSIPPVSAWTWYEGEADCRLSPVAARVDAVVRDTADRAGDDGRLQASRVTTLRNAFGPTLVDSEAIFKAAGRLIEAADHEVDIVSFAMEEDADPYRELVAGFERRLQSGKPLAQPFRIRLYTDHLSVFWANGLARRKARTLLTPWLELFRRYKLDPRAVQLEVYVHAHGALVYHHGGRFSVHDKFLVVDGRYLHIGGANPQKKNDYLHPERDTAVVLKGEVAASALGAFDTLWSRADFSCFVEQTGGVYQHRCADRRVPFRVEHSDAVSAPPLEEIGLSRSACLPVILLSKGKSGFLNVAGYSNPWARGVIAAVSSSTKEVAFSSPNMNAPPFVGALVDAMTDRAVTVRLLLPLERNEHQVNYLGGYGSNVRSLTIVNACAVAARLHSEEAYRRIRQGFQAAWWVAEGEREPFVGDGQGCFHTKFASFDGASVIVGSGNLDDQSFYHSSEASILIDNPAVTKAVAAFIFEPEWTRSAGFDWRLPRFTDLSAGREFLPETPATDPRHLCAGLAYAPK